MAKAKKTGKVEMVRVRAHPAQVVLRPDGSPVEIGDRRKFDDDPRVVAKMRSRGFELASEKPVKTKPAKPEDEGPKSDLVGLAERES